MKQKYLEKLEYNKILSILENFATTYIGKQAISNMLPSTDELEVKHLLSENTEANTLIYQHGNLPISEIEDITIHLKALKSGICLSTKQLLDLGNILNISNQLKEYFFQIDSNFSFPILKPYFENLYSNQSIQTKIFNTIIDEITIDDNASLQLANIRKSIKKAEQDIKQKLTSFMNSKYLQEPVITLRNQRYVIPVKQEYRSEIKGLVHDISSTGSTVFIEPLSVFELNNTLNSLKMEETIEIEKILYQLSSLFFELTNELENNIRIIGRLDFIFAKAKYGISINGVLPIIQKEKSIYLKKARHPLISKETVVPIDINLGKDFSTLVITGPNTGGKTVSLKTVGLLCLMAMSGLYIPANEGSSIYVFDSIFADIGDEQSISESLSTFSSHMINIIEILKHSTRNSLILLDELGSGTDPIEGANLAISILETLHNQGCLTISTTHYPEIKNYALTTSGFENASSEFCLETLSPTYKILIGIPGKSNAFSISQKLGLDHSILQRAKELMNKDTASIEELLKKLHDDKQLIETEKEKIIQDSTEIARLKNELETQKETIKQKEKEIIEKAKIEARNILLEAKEEASYAIKHIQSSDTKEINRIRNKLNDSLNNTKTSIIYSDVQGLEKEDITIGMRVSIPSLNQIGTILCIPNKSNEVSVQIGNARMNFSISKLQKVANSNSLKPISSSYHGTPLKSKQVTTEINVIGSTVEEATFSIDKYLDDCALAHLEQVRIVHGKGTGALRQGIHQFLKKHPHVRSFRLGTFGEGEMGVTIVELK